MPPAQKNCQYCGSPIPIGSDSCKSCQMSGEIEKSEERLARREQKQRSSKLMLVLLALVAVAVVAAVSVALYVRLPR